MFPFTWMLSVALKGQGEIFTFPPRILPENPTLDNFKVALDPTFLRYGLNSVIVAVITTVVAVLSRSFRLMPFRACIFRGGARSSS